MDWSNNLQEVLLRTMPKSHIMHEASIALSIIELVVRAAETVEGCASIRQVEITVGRLRAVEPELLVSCFELLSESTLHAKAKLICKQAPVTIICGDCGGHEVLSKLAVCCPFCASRDVSFSGGRELRVDRILAG